MNRINTHNLPHYSLVLYVYYLINKNNYHKKEIPLKKAASIRLAPVEGLKHVLYVHCTFIIVP